MEGCEGEQQYFVVYPPVSWKLVELNEERSDVVGVFCVSDDSSSRILGDLKSLNQLVGDTGKDGVAVVDEGVTRA